MCGMGNNRLVSDYAVGFARPDRRWGPPEEQAASWHAVEAVRPADELDGEVELAVCGAIVQVWGSQRWDKVGAGRAGCPECRQKTGASRAAPAVKG